MRTFLVLFGMVFAGCGDAVAPESEAVRIEVTGLERSDNGQWVATFSITNEGSATVFLPRCDDVLTGLEHWTGSEWTRLPVEACIAIRVQNPFVLEPGDVVRGDRVIPPAGRYRLHVRYTHEAGEVFDHTATTGPIDTASAVPESNRISVSRAV